MMTMMKRKVPIIESIPLVMVDIDDEKVMVGSNREDDTATAATVASDSLDDGVVVLKKMKKARSVMNLNAPPPPMTRSMTKKLRITQTASMFETIALPVLSSGYLHWYEAEQLGSVSRACRYAWVDQGTRDSYGGYTNLLKELNWMNSTNRCCCCEQALVLRKSSKRNIITKATTNTMCCGHKSASNDVKQQQQQQLWHVECAKREPNFHGVIDIIISTGVLTWREKGGIRKISKTCYKIQKAQCCCPSAEKTQEYAIPFLRNDPRFSLDTYDDLSDYHKCVVLSKYTSWLIQNLHSHYSIESNEITDESKLPRKFQNLTWSYENVQMVTLQQRCPRRYTFIVNMITLYMAQNELQRSPPKLYANSFLNNKNNMCYGVNTAAATVATGVANPTPIPAFELERLESTISEFCLPATDEHICRFLQTKCYPADMNQQILGPNLAKKLSIFGPFFDMVPPSLSSQSLVCVGGGTAHQYRHHDNAGSPFSTPKPTKLPKELEVLTDEMIDSMSLNFFCTIS